MKLRIFFLVLLLSLAAVGQTTNYTATIVDSNGQAYANGTVKAEFLPAPSNTNPAAYKLNGSSFQQTWTASLDGTGTFNFAALPDNTVIAPSGSFWKFTICSAATSPCFITIQQVRTASQNGTAAIQPDIVTVSVKSQEARVAYADGQVESPVTGSWYIQHGSLNLRYFNGTSWNTVAGGGGGGGAINGVSQNSVPFGTPLTLNFRNKFSCSLASGTLTCDVTTVENPLTFSGLLSRSVDTITLVNLGNGLRAVTTDITVPPATDNCAKWGAGGKLADAGVACGSGGGGGSPAGVDGDIQKKNGTAFAASALREGTSDVTSSKDLKSPSWQSTDTVNNMQIDYTAGSGGDATCPAPTVDHTYTCYRNNQLEQSVNGNAYAKVVSATDAPIVHDHSNSGAGGNLTNTAFAAGNKQGNGTKVQMSSATSPSNGAAACFDVGGNVTDDGCTGGGGSGFDPLDSTKILLVDDFCGANTSTSIVGQLNWTVIGTGQSIGFDGAGSFSHPCYLKLQTGTTANNWVAITLGQGNSVRPFGALGSNANWGYKFIFQLSSTTNGAKMKVGFTSISAVTAPNALTDGFWLKWDTGDAAFSVQTCAASVCTTGATTYTLDTGWHSIQISSSVAGQIVFSFDGGAPQTLSTNVSTSTMTPYQGVLTDGVSQMVLYTDFFGYSATGLTR